DELRVKEGDQLRSVSAEEIFRSILEKEQVFPDVAPGIPESLHLSFSRYPVELSIQIGHTVDNGESQFACLVNAETRSEASEVLNFCSRKSDHIVFNDVWYPFATGSVNQITEVLQQAGVSETGQIGFKAFLLLRNKAQSNGLVIDRTAGQILHPRTEFAPDEASPALFSGSLYPYQREGRQWLTFISEQELGGILADEMGLGKTVQIIATLASPNRSRYVPSLVVAPTTLLENWRREFKKFAPAITTLVHQGAQRTGLPRELGSYDTVITSYETVVRDGSLFAMIDWRIVILDEAQAIKNPDTRRSAAMKRLKRASGIAVTGTPVENNLRDLWSILDFAVPGYLGDEQQFEQKFCNDTEGAAMLEPYVSPLMLRRRVAEVARDLPPRIDIPEVLMLTERESALYEQIRQEIIEEYGAAANLVALTKLRMFCAHPRLLEEDEHYSVDEFSKFRRLCEIAEEIYANDEKVIVFTSYNMMSDIIRDYMRSEYSVFAETIDGRTKVSERQQIVDRFTEYGGPGLLTLNPRAAGTGLNITAANHVIHYNLEWNPAVEDQASGRAYRRGQLKPVTVHRLFIADTVEEVINYRLQSKRDISETAVVGVVGDVDERNDILRALQVSPIK
ncbi:DEAD/DEAH box helicase, partial [Pseudomonadota bacterium]